ncbi:DUF4407 domain-containing protein, partial [Microbacterium maritypicum]
MPYSAHRPGRYDSQGRIILDSEPDAVTDDLDFLREFEPTGTDDATREASASAPSEATPIADALVSEEPAPVKPPR